MPSQTGIVTKRIDVDGVATSYRFLAAQSNRSSETAVIMIHGGQFGQEGASCWLPSTFEELSANHAIYAIDRLGQGYTDNPSSAEGYRMSAVVDHVRAFIKALGLTSVILVGHSRGAYVSARVAQLSPTLVKSLVLINSASLALDYEGEAVPGTRTYEIYQAKRTGDTRHDLALSAMCADFLTDGYIAEYEAQVKSAKNTYAAEIFRTTAHRAFFDEFKVDRRDVQGWMGSSDYRVPTLLFWGVGDPTTTAQEGFDLFDHFSRYNAAVRLYCMPQSGHGPFQEYPREFARVVDEFLALVRSGELGS